MQTIAWMAFFDSTHFFDKNPYKIPFISSYGLEDTKFSENR
jgi:hypothetical protein